MNATTVLPAGIVLTGVNHPGCEQCHALAARQAEEIVDQPAILGSSTLVPAGSTPEPQMHGARVTHPERVRANDRAERQAVLAIAADKVPFGRREMDGRAWQVLAAAFAPYARYGLHGHHAVLALVSDDVWADPEDTDVAPGLDETRFAVATYLHDDDTRESFWIDATFQHDPTALLTYTGALAEFGRRIASTTKEG